MSTQQCALCSLCGLPPLPLQHLVAENIPRYSSLCELFQFQMLQGTHSESLGFSPCNCGSICRTYAKEGSVSYRRLRVHHCTRILVDCVSCCRYSVLSTNWHVYCTRTDLGDSSFVLTFAASVLFCPRHVCCDDDGILATSLLRCWQIPYELLRVREQSNGDADISQALCVNVVHVLCAYG